MSDSPAYTREEQATIDAIRAALARKLLELEIDYRRQREMLLRQHQLAEQDFYLNHLAARHPLKSQTS